MSAINKISGVETLKTLKTLKTLDVFAAIGRLEPNGFYDFGRSAALARYRRNHDAFAALLRGFDLLGANRAFASYVEALNATTQSVFRAYMRRSLDGIINSTVIGAVPPPASLRANPLVFGNVADVRVHDLLRQRVIYSGVELSWDEIYGEALRELVEWLRQPVDRVELERRSYAAGAVYGTVQAADAFAQGNVAMGVAHTMFALWCLQQYWELRRLR
jgi:hypothetical protein